MTDITYRSATTDAIDQKQRTVQFSFASTYPVLRFFGYEVLSHQPDAMLTERLDAGAVPLLLNHDPARRVCKIIDYYQRDTKTFATTKL